MACCGFSEPRLFHAFIDVLARKHAREGIADLESLSIRPAAVNDVTLAGHEG
jgi:hypothetical protein